MRGRNKGSLWSDAFITCRDLARRRRRSASPTRPAAYGARDKTSDASSAAQRAPRLEAQLGRAGQPAGHSAGPRAAVPSARDKQERQANSEGASVPGANHRSLPAGRVRGHHPALGLLAGPSRHRVRRSGLVTMLAGGPHSSGHGQASLGEVASTSGRPGRGFA